MGREIACNASYNGNVGTGKVLLETDEIIFRGDFRLRISRKSITGIETENGYLALTWPKGTARFELGAQSAKWADSIRNPPTRMDKLGVKAGMTARLIGIADASLEDELRKAGAEVVHESPADITFYQADSPADLYKLPELRANMSGADTLWIASPRGRPEIADVVVMAAGKAAGLVDIKVCRFSETHTALKFVIPKSER